MHADFVELETIEYEACADLYRAAPPAVVAAYDVRLRVIGAATCLSCRGLDPSAMFRRAIGLGVTRAATESDLEAVHAYMQPLDMPYAVPVAPSMQPPRLERWLAARGFSAGYAWMKFARACTEEVESPTALAIEVVGPARSAEFGGIVAAGFGLPAATGPWLGALAGRSNWVCVMASAEGVGVAAGAVYVRGDYAWIGFGATLPSHRRHGAQGALLARRLREAAARGARVAVTETGERLPDKPSNSYRNILRAGFEERYLRQNYLSPPP
jgi:GNAT superfamily N-acetyltransferase